MLSRQEGGMAQTDSSAVMVPGNGPSVRRVVVDAALAKRWLAENPRNRPIQKAYVRELAAQMRDGRWRFAGDPIRRAEGNALLDGQHRLHAVIEADTAVPFFVIEGMDPNAQDVMDRGRKRTIGHVLSIHGATSGNTLAAALGWLHAFEHRTVKRHGGERSASSYATPQEILDLWAKHPDLEKSLRMNNAIQQAPFRYSPSLGVALHYRMSRIDPDAADEFFERLISGTELVKGDAIYVLREQLMRNSVQRLRRPYVDLAAWSVQAWNAWRASRAVGRLLYRPGSDFPELEG